VNHLPILPILVPAFTAVSLLVLARLPIATKRAVSVLSLLGLAGVSIALLSQASAETLVYRLGDWVAPYGIVLVLDRLAALMVSLTAAVGLGAVLAASRGVDLTGRNFHALLHFQLMGLNGAFLTGDIFNLFVFFEILLIASYGLMLHGGGKERVGAGLHYVILNLGGSAFFVIGLGMVYGSLGTLNMADLSLRVAAVGPGLQAVVQAAALLLLVVFGLKAALLPLYFWLPRTYGATSAPVAALFAIMTKVGVYAIVRVYTVVFSNEAPVMAGLPGKVLLPISLATIVLATIGALAARSLRTLVANLLIASVGVMLTSVALFTEASLAAGLYYMVHSTLVVAALFLIVSLISAERGPAADALQPAPQVAHAAALGTLFFVCAAAIGGLPPFGGFLGKVYVLRSAVDAPGVAWIWGIILGGSLFSLLALARAGSAVFWKTEPVEAVEGEDGDADDAEETALVPPRLRLVPDGFAAALLLLVLMTGVAALAGPLGRYVDQTAAQLTDTAGYIENVLGEEGVAVRSGASDSTPVASVETPVTGAGEADR
jgi:multicomponent K+:H+ antiporter subunit D